MSQFLLYFDAFWAALGVLTGGGLGILGLLVLAGYVYGAAGIASEKKLGYRVAVGVAFLPLVFRALIAVGAIGGLFGNITWVLFLFGADDPRLASNPVNVLFEYVLIVLLLHRQSREHQKIWFD